MKQLNVIKCKKCNKILQDFNFNYRTDYYDDDFYCREHFKWLSYEDREILMNTRPISEIGYTLLVLYFGFKHNLTNYFSLLNGLAQILPTRSSLIKVLKNKYKLIPNNDNLKYILTIPDASPLEIYTDKKKLVKALREKGVKMDSTKMYNEINALSKNSFNVYLYPADYLLKSDLRDTEEFNRYNLNQISDIKIQIVKKPEFDNQPPIIDFVPLHLKGKRGKTKAIVLNDEVIRKLFIMNFDTFKSCLEFIDKIKH